MNIYCTYVCSIPRGSNCLPALDSLVGFCVDDKTIRGLYNERLKSSNETIYEMFTFGRARKEIMFPF